MFYSLIKIDTVRLLINIFIFPIRCMYSGIKWPFDQLGSILVHVFLASTARGGLLKRLNDLCHDAIINNTDGIDRWKTIEFWISDRKHY
jgi:soluble P-type ATPase